MAIYTLVLYHFGQGFDGARLALNAKNFRMHNKRVYTELEKLTDKIIQKFKDEKDPEWPEIIESLLPEIENISIDERPGTVFFSYDENEKQGKILFIRAFYSFRFWRFGGYAYYQGINISDEGIIEILPDELINEVW